MGANTQKHEGGIRQEGWEMVGKKTVGSKDMMRSVEGRGMGWGTQDVQDGHHSDFREGKPGI